MRWSWTALALVAIGCEVHQVKPPPVSIQEYEQARAGDVRPYADRMVVSHNLQRVLDPDLTEAERIESLRLVSRLGVAPSLSEAEDAQVREQLASILADESASTTLRREVLSMLLKRDHPDMAAHVAKILPYLEPGSPMKQEVLEWLARHPAPDVLAELVKLWAKEESITSTDEPLYKQAVERLTHNKWDAALLDAINTEGFRARGSAIAVLAARVPRADLARAVLQTQAKTYALTAMQVFLGKFNYLPASGPALLNCVWLCYKDTANLDPAARLAATWRQNFGYPFDVRDFHLLSRLSRDPLRKNYQRTELVLELARAFIKRPHVPRKVTGSPGKYGFSDRFSKHVESLTMADLWNLYLLNEMLSRPRVREAMAVVIQRDRADVRSAWGGLVFYEDGQAEAKLYPPSYDDGPNDLVYVPTREALRDGRNALCRFHAHFEKADNADRAGPTAEELDAAREYNIYGLTLTSLADDAFCAHYYNPKGIVISLGRFTLK